MKALMIFLLILFNFKINANENTSKINAYQKSLMGKIAKKIVILSTYPSLEYPNLESEQILKKYPDGKVLLFGYGSLINVQSAAESISPEAIQSMRPVVAFGFKRIFNYKASHEYVSEWGKDLAKNEKAMLNIAPATTYRPIINGVVMEISPEDLVHLIEREIGYDLVPILVADWDEFISEDPSINIKIAYTFLVPDELRNGIDYTQTKYYPIRGYLQAVREGAAGFGAEFLDYWNATTYLGDGTTGVTQWDEKTFSGILDTKEP